MLEGQAEPVGRATRHREEVRVVRLGEIHDPGVVGEVGRLELGMAVDAETANDEPLEVPGEEVREPERAGLRVGHRLECRAAREHLVAMGARQALDPFVGEDGIEQAAGAAVGVGDEDPLVSVGARIADPASHKAGTGGSSDPPMGTWFRLKASFDISGFSAQNQVILRALKKHGMVLADNGSSWYMSGVPDPGWNNSDLHALGSVPGSAFSAALIP